MKRVSLFVILVLAVLLAVINEQKLYRTTAPKPDPVVKKIEPIKNLDERKVEGPVRMYYENGQLKAERVYKDSKLNGTYRMYYDNGQLKVEGTYKNDNMDGAFKYYNKNGQLQAEEVYRDNILVTRKVFNL